MIDRTEQAYDFLGSVVVIEASSSAIASRLNRLFSPIATRKVDEPAGKRFSLLDGDGCYRLYRNGRCLLRSPEWESVVGALVAEANRWAIGAFGGFAVHAGVVAGATGAIALPGASGEGKSTLVAALLGAGMEYVSDEVLAVPSGSRSVVPYPKPLGLSSESLRILGVDQPAAGAGNEWLVSAADLGALTATEPLDLAHVVRFVRRRGPARLVASSPADAVTALLRFSFNHFMQPEESFALAVELARTSRAWRLEYDDAPSAAALLAERLASATTTN